MSSFATNNNRASAAQWRRVRDSIARQLAGLHLGRKRADRQLREAQLSRLKARLLAEMRHKDA